MTSRRRTSGGIPERPALLLERLTMLNAAERFGVLATQEEGKPYASLVAYALAPDLKSAIFATPKNTRKYKNIVKAGEVALLLDNRSVPESPVAGAEAITLTGRARPLRRGKEWENLRALYLTKHPDLADFVDSPSTALVIVDIDGIVHVGNFQTVTSWNAGVAE